MERATPASKNILKPLTVATLGVVGLVYLADYLSERKKVTPIWKYNTKPPSAFEWEKYTRIITNPLMKTFAGGIVSHFWDWTKIPDQADYSQRWIQSTDNFYDKFVGKKLNPFLHALAHMASGVQQVFTIGLDVDQIKELGLEVNGYHYSFQMRGQDKIQKSRILVPPNEKVRILVGSMSQRVLALKTEGEELPIIIEGPFDRDDKAVKDLRQF